VKFAWAVDAVPRALCAADGEAAVSKLVLTGALKAVG
jgi:hypothetical protein